MSAATAQPPWFCQGRRCDSSALFHQILHRQGPVLPRQEGAAILILPAGREYPRKQEGVSRKRGVWGATPMNTGVSQVFIEGVPQSLFGSFLVTQKGTRPAGWNPPNKKVGATESVAPTKMFLTGAEGKRSFPQSSLPSFLSRKRSDGGAVLIGKLLDGPHAGELYRLSLLLIDQGGGLPDPVAGGEIGALLRHYLPVGNPRLIQ